MRSKRLIAKSSSAPPPPRITRARANFVPIAKVVEQDEITPDDTIALEKKTNNGPDEKTVVEVVETTLGGDDDEDVNDDEDDEDDVDDDDGSTPNAKPTCDWEAEKCYSLGIRPSMCRRSGCPKFAHQYCQDQWGRKNSVKPYNVSYALCREHHPQYCRYIEELNADSSEERNAKGSDDGGKELFAKATGNEDEKQDGDDDGKELFAKATSFGTLLLQSIPV